MVEDAVSSVIHVAGAVFGREEVSTPLASQRLLGLLRAPSVACEVAVAPARQESVAEDRLVRRPPNPHLATIVLACPQDGAGGDLGLVDRWDGLRMVGELGTAPRELRGIERRQVNHGKADL